MTDPTQPSPEEKPQPPAEEKPPAPGAGSRSQARQESPGSDAMGWKSITAITLYLLLVAFVVVHGLVVVWPPNRDRETLEQLVEDAVAEQLAEAGAAVDDEEAETTSGEPQVPEAVTLEDGTEDTAGTETDTSRANADGGTGRPGGTGERGAAGGTGGTGGRGGTGGTGGNGEAGTGSARRSCPQGQERAEFLWLRGCLGPEERLFLIALLAGALGGLIHASRSFYWYLGNRELKRSWIGMYITLPFVAASMAVVFYLVVRAGFTAPNTDFDATNPFGIAALAALVGMFSPQAAERLKQVAEVIFTGAPTGKDHAGPPTMTRVVPPEGKTGEEVTIHGSGFIEILQVTFGGKAASQFRVVDDKTITATLPANQPGAVTVEVIAPGGVTGSLANGFTYTA